MEILRRFRARAMGSGLVRAATPILTKQLFYGAAVSCAVGLGLGVWLRPPLPHVLEPGVMQPVAADALADQGTVVSAPPLRVASPPPQPDAAVSPAADTEARPAPRIIPARADVPPAAADARAADWRLGAAPDEQDAPPPADPPREHRRWQGDREDAYPDPRDGFEELPPPPPGAREPSSDPDLGPPDDGD